MMDPVVIVDSPVKTAVVPVDGMFEIEGQNVSHQLALHI
jgi:hypothetical protein